THPVTASASPSAARSARLKSCDSRQRASAWRRSSDSPPALAWRVPMSRQRLHPLIWLARKWTRASVLDGTPAFSVDFASATSASIASGTIIAGFCIRACIIGFPFVSRRSASVRQWYDGSRSKDVTVRDLTESFEENRAHLRSVAYRMLDSL